MLRHLKNRMVVLTVMALLLAQIVPALALSISFTTEVGPFRILSSTISPNQTGVDGSSPGEFWRMTFSQPLGHGPGTIASALNFYAAGGTAAPLTTQGGGIGSNYVSLSLPTGSQLTPGAQYYVQLYALAADDGSLLDKSNSANSPYFHHTDGDPSVGDVYEIHFTAAVFSGWGTTTVNGSAGTLTGGQTNVPIVNAVIKVKSNIALQSGTVNATNVVLHKGAETGTTVTLGVSLDTDNQTIIMTPGTLEYNTTYWIVLTGVQDTTGTTLP